MTCVRLLLHIARLVAWLVVDYFISAACPGASAHRAARCRLLRLLRASDCFGMSRGSSRGSLSTTLHSSCVRVPRLVVRLVVDYFDYAARPGATTRRAARCAACCRLLRLVQARRRLLHLRRASGCLGTSCGSSRGSSSTTLPRAGSSSTTSPTPRVQVPRHAARLVKRFVVDYFTYAARLVALARRAACSDSSLTTSPHAGSSSTTSPTLHVRLPRHIARLITRLVVDYFAYAVRPGASARGSSSTTSPTPWVRLLRPVARLVA
jgi:hypothetical protein